MQNNPLNHLFAMGLAFGLLFAGANAVATSYGVPVPDVSELLECRAGGVHVNAITGPNGEFPIAIDCDPSDPAQGKCSDYGYELTSEANIAHTYLAISADQELLATEPSARIFPPGHTDGSKFLRFARHEYFVRFNANASVLEPHVIIKGASSPRISTVLVRVGPFKKSCLIAGPGIPGDPFQPVVQEQKSIVAGGQCEVKQIFDARGNLINIELTETSAPECTVRSPEVVLVNGEPLRNNTSPSGITFGNGTSTCYGPPVPRTPICVCTQTPCP